MQQYSAIFTASNGFGCHYGTKEACHSPCGWVEGKGCARGTCTAPQDPNAASPACRNGNVVADGSDCCLQCKPGYHPADDHRAYWACAECQNGKFDSPMRCVKDGLSCPAPRDPNAASP